MAGLDRLRPLAEKACDALLPPLCPVTGEETQGGRALSAAAFADLALIDRPGCGKCGREIDGVAGDWSALCEVCARRPRPWARGRAVCSYAGTGRALVLRLKHGDRLDLVPMVAGWLARAGAPLLAEADLIAPVPLHWTRLVRRRFNQSAELARATARAAGRSAAYAPTLLRRIRRTPSQGGKTAGERIANLEGAFDIAPRAPVAGARILLVDDVLTTGATLEALATLLQAHGAAAIDVLVMALVPYNPEAYLRRTTPIED